MIQGHQQSLQQPPQVSPKGLAPPAPHQPSQSPSQAKLSAAAAAQPQVAAEAPAAAAAAGQQQPKTYKEIKQRLAQQQYLQKLRLQQQQWIMQQQQLLLQNNPGINIDQVNQIIYQQLILQQQQHLQKVLALQEAVAKQEAVQKQREEEQATAQTPDETPSMSAEEIRQQQQAMVQQHQHMLMTQSAFQQLIYQQHLQQQQQTNGKGGAGGTAAGGTQNQQASQLTASQMQQTNVLLQANANGQIGAGPPGLATLSSLGKGGSQNQPGAEAGNNANKIQNAGGGPNSGANAQSNSASHQKTPSLVSYTQLLKQECQFDPQANTSNDTNVKMQLPQNVGHATNLPFENLKHNFQQFTSDIVRKVLARSDCMNLLRQIIDLKARKVKPKSYESQIFVTIMDKESQRMTQENQCLQKNALKIEDKTLVKALQKNVKKMLKPFKGLQFDDFLNNEIHLNEIMAMADQSKDPIKESRKRHLRILDAALKENVVDMQIVLGICVQISRQAFFNELSEYYGVAHEYIMANQSQFATHDITGIQNLKKKLGTIRSNQKVQIQQTKKLDRMFWLLLEQNAEVQNNIKQYKEKHKQKADDKPAILTDPAKDRQSLFRRQPGASIRSQSGIASGSPRVSSLNLHTTSLISSKQGGDTNKALRSSAAVPLSNQIDQSGSSVRRTVSKINRSSMHQNENRSQNRNITTAQQRESNVVDHLNSNTKLQNQQQMASNAGSISDTHSQTLKGSQLALAAGNKGGTTRLAPLQNQKKQAQSLIQKKGKARDLDSKLAELKSQNAANAGVDKTPDHAMTKKRMSSMNVHQVPNTASKAMIIQHQSTPSHQPVVQNHRSGRMVSKLNSASMNSGDHNQPSAAQTKGHHMEANNSTENMFNLIQATKTKNTTILEPISKQGSGGTQDGLGGQDITSPTFNNTSNEMGAGLRPKQGDQGFQSQPHNRQQRQFIISSPSKGQLSQSSKTHGKHFNIHLQNNHEDGSISANGDVQVLRSWSKPQIHQKGSSESAHIQVCTCARFRKRIDGAPQAGTTHSQLTGGIIGMEDNRAVEIPLSVRDRSSKLNLDVSDDDDGNLDEEEKEISGVRVSPSIIKIKSKARQHHDLVRESTQSELKIRKKKTNSSSSKTNNENQQVMRAQFGNMVSSPNAQRPPTSPSNGKAGRGHNPRGSLDFKMRILTKKKVVVPTTAINNFQDSARLASDEVNGGSFHSNGKVSRTGSQRQILSSQGNQSGRHSITLPKQKVVTYEICQDCGGQRPVGLPEVPTSALSELKKVKLNMNQINVTQLDPNNNGAEEPFTQRIDGSDRSSTLSLGREQAHHKPAIIGRTNPNTVLAQHSRPLINLQAVRDQQLQRAPPVKEPLILAKLNKRYLFHLNLLSNVPLLMIALNHRAKLIQDAVRSRNYRKRIAITQLQKFWRKYIKKQRRVRKQQALEDAFKTKVATRKIQEFSKLIKVHKVSASLMLNYHQINQRVQQAILKPAAAPTKDSKADESDASTKQNTADGGDSQTKTSQAESQPQTEQEKQEADATQISQEDAEKALREFEVKLVKVQRLWRARRDRQRIKGAQIDALKQRRDAMFNTVLNRKQYRAQNVESELFQQTIMHEAEHRNLDQYFWKQKVSLAKDLEIKAKKVQQKVYSEFNSADWTLNQITREWEHQKTSIVIRLQKGESVNVPTLRDRVVQYYIEGQLPDADSVESQLNDLLGARNAMQTLMQRDCDYKSKMLLTSLKRQRLQNLYFYEGPKKVSGHMCEGYEMYQNFASGDGAGANAGGDGQQPGGGPAGNQ